MANKFGGEEKKWVGKALPRKEEDHLLRGRGKFADDIKLRDMAYLCFVRSPYAHARIISIDPSAAEALPESYARSQAVKSNRRPNLSSKSAQSLAPKSAIIRWRFPQRCTRVSRSLLLWPNPRALQRTQPNSFRWNTNRWNPCWMRNRRWKTRAFFTRKWARIKSGTAFSNTEMWTNLFRKPLTWSTLTVCISIASPAR